MKRDLLLLDVPAPCNDCRLPNCFTLHNDCSIQCSFDACDSCLNFANLDKQIADVHSQLINLAKKRLDMKSDLNRRHDRLINRVPIEIIGRIFVLFAESDEHADPPNDTSHLQLTNGAFHLFSELSVRPGGISHCLSRNCGRMSQSTLNFVPSLNP